jgi:hypothetical protein
MFDAGDHVAIARYSWQSDSCCGYLVTVRKTDGTVVKLPGTSIAGAGDDWIALVDAGPSALLQSLSLVHPDGTGTVALGNYVGSIHATLAPQGREPAMTGVIACVASGPICAAGPLTEHDFAGGAAIVLGQSPATREFLIDGYAGIASGLRVNAAGTAAPTDAWQVVPGQAGSLARVTHHLP